MSRTWGRPEPDARRIAPQIPPLVEQLVRDLCAARKYRDEIRISEISGHDISGTEHQFGQRNHFTVRTLLAEFAVVGPERSCQATNPTLRELGLVLAPLPGPEDQDPAAAFLKVAAEVGDLAREHGRVFADRCVTASELAALEGIGGQLHQLVDVYLGAARAAQHQP